jgi:hypothetical protein
MYIYAVAEVLRARNSIRISVPHERSDQGGHISTEVCSSHSMYVCRICLSTSLR